MQFKGDYQNQIKVRWINDDPMGDLQKAAMNTIGKDLDDAKEMTPELFKRYLISEHSPIRAVSLEIACKNMYYPTSVHFSRHSMTTHYVTSSRPDRTGKERTLNDPISHIMICNPQALIDMMRKRLCKKCEKNTWIWACSIKTKLLEHEDPYFQALGAVLIPNCMYRMMCPEFNSCGDFQYMKNPWRYNPDKEL